MFFPDPPTKPAAEPPTPAAAAAAEKRALPQLALGVTLRLGIPDINHLLTALLQTVPDELSPRSAPPAEPAGQLRRLLRRELTVLDKEIIARHLELTAGQVPGQPGVPGERLTVARHPAGYRPTAQDPSPDRMLPLRRHNEYAETLTALLEKRRDLGRRIAALLPPALADQGDRLRQEYRFYRVPPLDQATDPARPETAAYYAQMERQYREIFAASRETYPQEYDR